MVRFIFLGVALITMVSMVSIAQQEVKIESPPGLTIISTSPSSDNNNSHKCAVDEEGTYYYYPQLPEEGMLFTSFDDCPPAPCKGAIVTKEGQVKNCDE